MLTYGDGLSNLNLSQLIKFHNKSKNIATLTAVRPPARFGAIKITGKKVKYFKEKSYLDEGWINGGFFVFEPKIFKYLKNDLTYLEREPMQKLSKQKLLELINIKVFGNAWTQKEIRKSWRNLLKLKSIELELNRSF